MTEKKLSAESALKDISQKRDDRTVRNEDHVTTGYYSLI